ncbi:unnamed protein product [Rotaria socialis]|uniref:Antifreeze protein n=1 Tax=Rotaria socialis TaxID=392032 RepID=A0A820YP54_9BILA|nr:unnamed protein product [Rotaria socialis]
MIPTILFIRLYAIILIILGQDAIISTASSCGSCSSQECRANPVPYSANVDCECLLMTMTAGGMCADTIVSCNDLTPCQNDNVTCLVSNTVCVNNSRCNAPVCYPLERASSQRCPPLNSNISNIITTLTSIGTTSISSTTTTVPTTLTTTIIYTYTPTTNFTGCTGQLFNCRWAPCISSFNGTRVV